MAQNRIEFQPGISMPECIAQYGRETGADSFGLRFSGQCHDQETGLHYNYFRDYDPSTGRHVQIDPIGLGGGPNRYVYVWRPNQRGGLRGPTGPNQGQSNFLSQGVS